MIFNLDILAKSKTPFDYKQTLSRLKSDNQKGIYDNSDLKNRSFNYVLLDNLTNKKSSCLKNNCVPIENIPNENETSTVSKSYIQAVKTKAFKNGLLALTPIEWRNIQIKISNCFKRNQFLIKEVFNNGECQKKTTIPYNVSTGNFLKKVTKSHTTVCDIEIEVDFFKKSNDNGYAIIFLNEKDIDPDKIVYKVHDKGLDIVSGVLIEAFKKKYNLKSFQVYIFGLETSYQTNSVMFKLNEISQDIGFDTFKKRMKTIYSSYEMNNFKGYQKTTNPIKINVNQTLIKKREQNESW